MALNLRDMTKRMMIGNIDIPLFIVMRPNPVHFDKSSRKRNSETYTNTGWVDTHWGNERDIIKVNGYTASRIGNTNQYKDSELLGASLKNTLDNYTYAGTDSHGPKQWAAIEQSLLKLEQIYKLDKEKTGNLLEALSSRKMFGLINAKGALEGAGRVLTNPFKSSKRKDVEYDFASDKDLGILKRSSSFIIYNYTIYWGYFTEFSYTDDVMQDPRRYSYNFTFKVTKSSTDWLSESMLNNFPEARALGLFTQLKDIASYTAMLVTNLDKMAKNMFI